MNNENSEINIEEIMRDIRAEILAKRVAVGSGGEPLVPTQGKRLPPEFYEHLYQAALAYGDAGVKMQVATSNIPLIGGGMDWLRGKLHELVLFYINQIVAQQRDVNYHLLRALAIASEKLEREDHEHIE